MMKPSDIKGKSFETERNGYSQSQVEKFLAEVAADYADLLRDSEEKDEKIAKLVDKINEYREEEDAIKAALLSAQKESAKILADARAKAKDMIDSAKSEQMKLAETSAAECEKIVRDHKERCAQLIQENTELTEKKITALREAYDEEKAAYESLRAEVTYFKADLTALYNEQIKLILQLPQLSDEELDAYESSLDEEYEDYEDELEETEAEAQAEAASISEDLSETAEEAAVEAETDAEEEAEEEAAAEEEADAEESQEEKKTDIDKVLNTGSFEPVIPRSSLTDLKFGQHK